MTAFIRRLSRGNRIMQIRRQLGALSDGQLRDLGLSRGQVQYYARYVEGGAPRPDSN